MSHGAVLSVVLLLVVTPHTPHVVVDQIAQPVNISDSGWAIFAAWAAAGAATATGILAYLTRNLANATSEMSSATGDMVLKTAALATQTAKQAEESAQSIEQAQRHHEQSLMPIVWVLMDCTRTIRPDNSHEVNIKGKVLNAGPGPAVNIFLHFSAHTYQPQYAIYLGLIGPNSERPFDFHFKIEDQRNVIEDLPYDCLTRYETLFGTWGAIVQRSYSGRMIHQAVTKYFAPSNTSEKDIASYLARSSLPAQTSQ